MLYMKVLTQILNGATLTLTVDVMIDRHVCTIFCVHCNADDRMLTALQLIAYLDGQCEIVISGYEQCVVRFR